MVPHRTRRVPGGTRLGGSPGCAGVLCWLVAVAPYGCVPRQVDPVRLANRHGPMTIAVAPALNASGSADVDVDRAADLMASELSYVEGVNVIPVNRVLGVLQHQGLHQVQSAEHALDLVQRLGADAILVFAITEYDAYDPPVVGITAQLYGRFAGSRVVGFDPVRDARKPSPPDRPTASPLAPIAQEARVFNGAHEWVVHAVRRFAAGRGADESPLGWRKYLASQQHYLRFCCHETIKSLLGTADRQEGGEDDGRSG